MTNTTSRISTRARVSAMTPEQRAGEKTFELQRLKSIEEQKLEQARYSAEQSKSEADYQKYLAQKKAYDEWIANAKPVYIQPRGDQPMLIGYAATPQERQKLIDEYHAAQKIGMLKAWEVRLMKEPTAAYAPIETPIYDVGETYEMVEPSAPRVQEETKVEIKKYKLVKEIVPMSVPNRFYWTEEEAEKKGLEGEYVKTKGGKEVIFLAPKRPKPIEEATTMHEFGHYDTIDLVSEAGTETISTLSREGDKVLRRKYGKYADWTIPATYPKEKDKASEALAIADEMIRKGGEERKWVEQNMPTSYTMIMENVFSAKGGGRPPLAPYPYIEDLTKEEPTFTIERIKSPEESYVPKITEPSEKIDMGITGMSIAPVEEDKDVIKEVLASGLVGAGLPKFYVPEKVETFIETKIEEPFMKRMKPEVWGEVVREKLKEPIIPFFEPEFLVSARKRVIEEYEQIKLDERARGYQAALDIRTGFEKTLAGLTEEEQKARIEKYKPELEKQMQEAYIAESSPFARWSEMSKGERAREIAITGLVALPSAIVEQGISLPATLPKSLLFPKKTMIEGIESFKVAPVETSVGAVAGAGVALGIGKFGGFVYKGMKQAYAEKISTKTITETTPMLQRQTLPFSSEGKITITGVSAENIKMFIPERYVRFGFEKDFSFKKNIEWYKQVQEAKRRGFELSKDFKNKLIFETGKRLKLLPLTADIKGEFTRVYPKTSEEGYGFGEAQILLTEGGKPVWQDFYAGKISKIPSREPSHLVKYTESISEPLIIKGEKMTGKVSFEYYKLGEKPKESLFARMDKSFSDNVQRLLGRKPEPTANMRLEEPITQAGEIEIKSKMYEPAKEFQYADKVMSWLKKYSTTETKLEVGGKEILSKGLYERNLVELQVAEITKVFPTHEESFVLRGMFEKWKGKEIGYRQPREKLPEPFIPDERIKTFKEIYGEPKPAKEVPKPVKKWRKVKGVSQYGFERTPEVSSGTGLIEAEEYPMIEAEEYPMFFSKTPLEEAIRIGLYEHYRKTSPYVAGAIKVFPISSAMKPSIKEVMFEPSQIGVQEIPVTEEVTKLREDIIGKSEIREMNLVRIREGIKEMVVLRESLAPRQAIAPREKLALKEKLAVTEQPRMRTQPIITPTPRVFSITIPPAMKVQKLEGIRKGFIVEVKRFGKWLPKSKPLEYGQALYLGQKVARKTLARSFRLREGGKAIESMMPSISEPSLKEFRGYKISKGKKIPLNKMFIQKAKFSLSAPSEVLEIQRARKGVRYLI